MGLYSATKTTEEIKFRMLRDSDHSPIKYKRVAEVDEQEVPYDHNIQTALVTVGKPRHRREDKGFIFLDFATCGSCGFCITGERHIKKSGLRFHYYRCTHKNKIKHCEDRTFVRQEKFAAEVKRNTELVALPEEWKEKFLAKIETWEVVAAEGTWVLLQGLCSELTLLKAKLDRINNAFADGDLGLNEFKELKNPLIPKKVELEEQIRVLERTKTNRLELLRRWIFEANQAQTWALEENWLEMKSFLKNVGSNRLLRGETLTISFKKPWNLLALTVVASRDIADLSARNSGWWSLRDSNP